jgi:hypothetical protein
MDCLPGTAKKSWTLAGSDFTNVGGTWIHNTVFQLYGALRNVSHYRYTGALERLWRSNVNNSTGNTTARPNRETFLRHFSQANSTYMVRNAVKNQSKK